MVPAALRHRDFSLFWGGVVLSAIGSQFTTVAMAWQIYELTNSAWQIGLLGLARAVPQIALALLGVVPAQSPAEHIREFLELAKKAPGSYNYGSAGIGTLNHLGVELLKVKTGTTFVHTPHSRGTSAAPNPVDGNGIVQSDVQFMMASGPLVEKLVKEGWRRALVVFNDKRVQSLPNVPTAAEAGLPSDMVVSSWMGLAAPAATPAPNRLHRAGQMHLHAATERASRHPGGTPTAKLLGRPAAPEPRGTGRVEERQTRPAALRRCRANCGG